MQSGELVLRGGCCTEEAGLVDVVGAGQIREAPLQLAHPNFPFHFNLPIQL